MFNSTHTLVGLALTRTGLNRWVPRAGLTAIIASNLPDLDIITQFGGTTTYLDHHRGITHTIIATPVLSLLLACLMCSCMEGFKNWRGRMLWKYFLIALIAMSTHPLLDWANTYGVRPYVPFSDRWYYGDTLFIIDPYLDLILLVGIVLSYKFSNRHRFVAVTALILAMVYISTMVELRNRARHLFESSLTDIPDVRRAAVAPEFLDPLHWRGFVETGSEVASFGISQFTGEVSREQSLTKAAASSVTTAAEATRTAAVFRNFARFPVIRVQQNPTGYRVLLIDFRFIRSSPQTALSAEILLTNDLKVVGESMSFIRPID